MGDFGALQDVLLSANGSEAFQNTVAALASAAKAAAHELVGGSDQQQEHQQQQHGITAIQKAALIDQLQRSLNDSDNLPAVVAIADGGGHAATADGSSQLPHNLTLIFNELQRFSFRSEDSLQPYKTHGMTDEEYSRFVSDMWIGIVLSMLVVFIVLALCLWFLYHKFQQWKRQYNEVHNSHTLTHVLTTSPVGLDASFNDETLPNYTLVSGLPTYDDALEQIRHTNSTNHLLINHQTLMKLFGSAPAAMGNNNSKDPNNFTITSTASGGPSNGTNTPTYCSNCNAEEFVSGGSAKAASSTTEIPPRMYLARIESCQLQQLLPGAGNEVADSRRSSLANVAAAATQASSNNISSNGTTTIITTGSGHRFICTTVSTAPRLIAPVTSRRFSNGSGGTGGFGVGGLDRRRASEASTPAGGFRRLLSLNPDAVAALQYQNDIAAAAATAAAAHNSTSGATSGAQDFLTRPNSLSLMGRRLADVPSNSTGCLNVHTRQRDRNYNTVQMAASPTTGSSMAQRRQRWYSTNEVVDEMNGRDCVGHNVFGIAGGDGNGWTSNRWSMGFNDVPNTLTDDVPMNRQTGGSAGNLSAEALYRHRMSLY